MDRGNLGPLKGDRVRVIEVAANGAGFILPVGTEITLEQDAVTTSRTSHNHWVRLVLYVGEAEGSSDRLEVQTRQMRVQIVALREEAELGSEPESTPVPAAPPVSEGARLVFAATFSRAMREMRQRGILVDFSARTLAAAEAFNDAMAFEEATGHSAEVARFLAELRRTQ